FATESSQQTEEIRAQFARVPQETCRGEERYVLNGHGSFLESRCLRSTPRRSVLLRRTAPSFTKSLRHDQGAVKGSSSPSGRNGSRGRNAAHLPRTPSTSACSAGAA